MANNAVFYIFGAVAGPAAPFFNLVGGALSVISPPIKPLQHGVRQNDSILTTYSSCPPP
jgi:hypothetical protein